MSKSRLALTIGLASAINGGALGFNEPRYQRSEPESYDEFKRRHRTDGFLIIEQPDTTGYGYAKKQRAASRRRKS